VKNFLYLTLTLICTGVFCQSDRFSRVSGVVRNGSGAPVEGVAVTLAPWDSPVPLTVRSDSDGSFHFSALPGKYSLSAEAESVTVTYSPVLVAAPGASVIQNVSIVPITEGIWDGYEYCHASDLDISLSGRVDPPGSLRVCLDSSEVTICKSPGASHRTQFSVSPRKYILKITRGDSEMLASVAADMSACGSYQRRVVLLN